MIRCLAVFGIAVGLAGCVPSGHPNLATAVQPHDIAYAMCLQDRPADAAGCNSVRLPSRTSETAYSLCLDYHPSDPRPCGRVRAAYMADLRAYLTEPAPAQPAARAPSAHPPEITERRYNQLHHTAEQLYLATSRDAQTFEAALLIPEVRRKVERVLGPRLSDDKLRALARKSRAEALYWYRYMQGLEQLEKN